MKYPVFIVLLIILQSCSSTRPISKLEPTSAKTLWSFGNEVTQIMNNNISVSTYFYRNQSEHLIFNVEVVNYSGDTVLVDPQAFYYTLSDNDSLGHLSREFAINPEERILHIDKQLSRTEAVQRNEATANFASSALELAVDISSIGQQVNYEDEEQERWENQKQQRTYNYRNSTEQNLYNISSLNDQRSYWEFETLRKTSLPPSHSIRGMVIFNRSIYATSYFLFLPIQGINYKFPYNQKLVNP